MLYANMGRIICFSITIIISIICIIIAIVMEKKLDLGIVKFQIGWILFMDVLAVVLLVSNLQYG